MVTLYPWLGLEQLITLYLQLRIGEMSADPEPAFSFT